MGRTIILILHLSAFICFCWEMSFVCHVKECMDTNTDNYPWILARRSMWKVHRYGVLEGVGLNSSTSNRATTSCLLAIPLAGHIGTEKANGSRMSQGFGVQSVGIHLWIAASLCKVGFCFPWLCGDLLTQGLFSSTLMILWDFSVALFLEWCSGCGLTMNGMTTWNREALLHCDMCDVLQLFCSLHHLQYPWQFQVDPLECWCWSLLVVSMILWNLVVNGQPGCLNHSSQLNPVYFYKSPSSM